MPAVSPHVANVQLSQAGSLMRRQPVAVGDRALHCCLLAAEKSLAIPSLSKLGKEKAGSRAGVPSLPGAVITLPACRVPAGRFGPRGVALLTTNTGCIWARDQRLRGPRGGVVVWGSVSQACPVLCPGPPGLRTRVPLPGRPPPPSERRAFLPPNPGLWGCTAPAGRALHLPKDHCRCRGPR